VIASGGSLGAPKVVASVHDSGLDGVIRKIDANLSAAAGAQTLSLRVEAGPSSAQDWAVWVNPQLAGRPGG
jgi:hypothetical protein